MKILVAEDNDQLRTATARILERMGHEVVPVSDGVCALEVVLEGGFDLIVSDLDMPRMSGMDLWEKLPSELRGRFILHSGNQAELDRLAGTIPVVPKGEPPSVLRGVVEQMLAREGS